jgi:UrcA family protein
MRSGRTLSALAIATALGLAATSGAMAQGSSVSELTIRGASSSPGGELKHEPIKYTDLDLKSQAGAETLIGRLRAAATRVCHPIPTHKANFKDVDDFEKCRSQAVSHAVQDLGNPMVKQVFDRTGD